MFRVGCDVPKDAHSQGAHAQSRQSSYLQRRLPYIAVRSPPANSHGPRLLQPRRERISRRELSFQNTNFRFNGESKMTFQCAGRRLKVGALGLVVSFALSGAVLARECKSDPVVAEGQPAVSRDLGAYPNSLFAWRKAVAEKVGGEFNSWRYADARSVDCNQIDTKNGKRWSASARRFLQGYARRCFRARSCSSNARASPSRPTGGAKRRKRRRSSNQVGVAHRRAQEVRRGLGNGIGRADHDCRKIGDKFQCIGVGTPCRTSRLRDHGVCPSSVSPGHLLFRASGVFVLRFQIIDDEFALCGVGYAGKRRHGGVHARDFGSAMNLSRLLHPT